MDRTGQMWSLPALMLIVKSEREKHTVVFLDTKVQVTLSEIIFTSNIPGIKLVE